MVHIELTPYPYGDGRGLHITIQPRTVCKSSMHRRYINHREDTWLYKKYITFRHSLHESASHGRVYISVMELKWSASLTRRQRHHNKYLLLAPTPPQLPSLPLATPETIWQHSYSPYLAHRLPRILSHEDSPSNNTRLFCTVIGLSSTLARLYLHTSSIHRNVGCVTSWFLTRPSVHPPVDTKIRPPNQSALFIVNFTLSRIVVIY